MLTPHYEITLSDAEQQPLQALVRAGKTPQQLALRATIILRAQDGVPNQQIAEEVGPSRTLVQKGRKRFARYVPPPPAGGGRRSSGAPRRPAGFAAVGSAAGFFPRWPATPSSPSPVKALRSATWGGSHYSVRDWARLVEGRGAILTLSPATGQRILAALVLNPPGYAIS
jgi:hypothetical protein